MLCAFFPIRSTNFSVDQWKKYSKNNKNNQEYENLPPSVPFYFNLSSEPILASKTLCVTVADSSNNL